ncbi:cyclin-dependent kinase 11A [Dicentrarchus labrax]|uniref:cyclin-dependent kinase 11A n=1 Tax=Dicentrarchus labrax TaxID=13489 RepID=UPI0021F56817|nr:cyclin-dependent kinase 11A [Dicentrarchus labrax]XP_051284410.1 cyclin-dependent kinase 11A [Dicentrarchus labrax]XP_051284411.1 cyclin-dependent kinase 11A [Dicentrarchus labrax]XP_051284413.1 cyclin-dependent kinase 11A [Dicentrarchus labrax]XP_051284414.1 cyclin-dependent kinase 11A [Dicentrarchus labrax]
MSDQLSKSKTTVLLLFFCLLGLLALLFFLYKKLNREANGEYTIERIVYKEGGVRDWVRGTALALEARLGVQLWPRGDTDEDGEEMQEVQDEEQQVEVGSSQGSDSERDEDEDEEEEQCGKTSRKSITSDDNSYLGDSVGEEHVRLMDEPEAKAETGERGEEKSRDGDSKGEASGAPGLLIDLKQISGSAIWSEEGGMDSDVTAL